MDNHGTWLPGDERGSWHTGDSKPANELFREMADSKMRETAFVLSSKDRKIVESTVAKHCEIRKWQLHAVNARTNHVHAVLTAFNYGPDTVREQLKAWCTRKLKPHHPGRNRFWTEGGSRRWINQVTDLEAATVYVAEGQ